MAFQMINVWIDMKFARADLDCSPIMNLLIIVTGPKGFAMNRNTELHHRLVKELSNRMLDLYKDGLFVYVI